MGNQETSYLIVDGTITLAGTLATDTADVDLNQHQPVIINGGPYEPKKNGDFGTLLTIFNANGIT
jgi:hypothetical protein